ncbi:glycosyltransferase, partial [Candidatus Gottesmanbacteria bacterium]|nr:glycosyltransferase [Candidatus Gottesmanbacteria bacterium]
GIVFKEDVTDIRTELKKVDIFLAPIQIGGGTKFKILEAMAAGVPVVTTPKGMEGLEMVNGKEVLVVTNWDHIGQIVEQLLTDDAYRLELVRAARTRIERDYSWEKIAKQLDTAWIAAYEKRH